MAAAAAVVSRDVPEATLDPLSIKAKKMVIDDAAMKADRAASLAMEEARQEEEEEKAIESSVEDGSGLDGSKPLPAKVVKSAEEPSRSQLAERVMKLMGEAPAQSEKLQSTEVAIVRLKKAMQRRLQQKKEAGQTPAEVKTEELARIEAAEAETKQKMAALRQQKSEQEAQLEEAEAHAQGIQAEAQKVEVKLSSVPDAAEEANEGDLDAFVHKVVKKKFGKHWKHANTAAVKLAEARMKKLVESRLKQKLMKRQQQSKATPAAASAPQSPKLDIEAMVEKKLKNSRLHLSNAAVERIRKRMKADLQRKLSPALAQPAAEGKSAGRPANAMVHVGKQISRVQEDDEEGAKDAESEGDSTQDDSEQDDAQVSSAQDEDDSGDGEESSASDAEEKSNSNDAEAESEDSHEEEADSSSDDEDSEPAAEAFLQRLRAKVRQPVLFSTEDADLQPYLHPKPKENLVSDDTCKELCKFKTGSKCVTECNSFADAGGDVDALKVSDAKRVEDPLEISVRKQAVEQVAQPEEPEVDAGSAVDSLKVSAATEADDQVDKLEEPEVPQDPQSDADLDDSNIEEALSTAEAQPEQDQVAPPARKQFLEP